MRKRKKISLDDVCSGKEALRKGTEALNKSNQIMSNTTISADEGHFELAKSICMANNHIPLQLQIIQPFLPDEAGIFLWLVSIPSEAVSRIPASRPSTSWWYPPPANPRVLPALSCGWPVLPSFTTWHWQHGRVTLGCWAWKVTGRAGGRGRRGCFFPLGDRRMQTGSMCPSRTGFIWAVSGADAAHSSSRHKEGCAHSHRLCRKGEGVSSSPGLPAWLGPRVCDVLLQTLLMASVCPHCWIDLELEAANQTCWNAQQRNHSARGNYRTWPFCSVAVQHLGQELESWPVTEALGGQSSSIKSVMTIIENITQADVIPCGTPTAQEQWTQAELNKLGFSLFGLWANACDCLPWQVLAKANLLPPCSATPVDQAEEQQCLHHRTHLHSAFVI